MMPDGMALDPYVAPFQIDQRQQPPVQVAEAQPAAPAPAQPPAALPGYYDLRTSQGDAAPDAQPPTAVQTTAPPAPGQQQPQQPAQQPAYVIDDKIDEDDYQQSQLNEATLYDKNVLSHKTGRAQPLDVTPQQHPEWDNFQSIMEDWKKMTPKEQAARRMPVQQMYNRIQSDTKRAQADLREKRRAEAHGLDAPRLTREASEKTSSLMDGYLTQEQQAVIAGTTQGPPEKRRQNDFNLKTSPLTTMSITGPDGKKSSEPLRNAVTSVAQLNDGVYNEQIVRYVLAIGSPVGFDDKSGVPLPGRNDVGGKVIHGKGATNYKFLGRDAADNVMVEMDDGQQLRIPPQTYRNLQRARERGYEEAKKWRTADKAAREEKGLGTRILETIIPKKGF